MIQHETAHLVVAVFNRYRNKTIFDISLTQTTGICSNWNRLGVVKQQIEIETNSIGNATFLVIPINLGVQKVQVDVVR